MVRVQPGAYSVGQSTISERHIDPDFAPKELEWYTKRTVGIVADALLVRVLNFKLK